MSQISPMATIDGLKSRSRLWLALAIVITAGSLSIGSFAIAMPGQQASETYRDLGLRHGAQDFALPFVPGESVSERYEDLGLRHGAQDFALPFVPGESQFEHYEDFGLRHGPEDLGLPSQPGSGQR
jgi:hypothetical protein